MKKAIITACLATIFTLCGCYDDGTTLGNNSVGDIIIGELADQSVVSYTGTKLEIAPQVDSDYPESDLTYAWYFYNNGSGTQESGYRENKIADTKNLDYEVRLPSGAYTFVFEVTSKSNQYSQTATMNVSVSTPFSKGFYILKETADGQTELDFYNGTQSIDLMKQITGQPLSGKPENIAVIYNGEYIDTETNTPSSGNILNICTQDGSYKGFRTEDMKEVLNNTNLFYSGDMPANERPYNFVKSMFLSFYFSNTGVRYASLNGELGSDPGSGKLGYPVDNCSSINVQVIDYGMNIAYWNNTSHNIKVIDYNCTMATPLDYYDNTGQLANNAYPSDLECISSGNNTMGGITTTYFLCEQPSSGDRYLFLLTSSMQIDQIIKIDPSTHLAKSKVIAGNGLTASYIYCAENDKLYAYSWQTGSEEEVVLPGITNGEEINYISNQYLNMGMFADQSMNFNNLIIGTQKDGSYTLYFYHEDDMTGGMPTTEPSEKISGTGSVKAVRFLSPIAFTGMDIVSMMDAYPFPTTN